MNPVPILTNHLLTRGKNGLFTPKYPHQSNKVRLALAGYCLEQGCFCRIKKKANNANNPRLADSG